MSDFAPPSGPPPPKVPEGWKAVWNSQYNEWFYVNVYTKKSQWDKPTEPVYASPDGAPPGGPPPTYDHASGRAPGPEKYGSNNPYGGGGPPNTSDDERYARELQRQEQERAGGSASRGAADSYYQGGGSGPGQTYGQQQAPAYGQGAAYGQSGSSPAPPEKRGLFSRLTGGGNRPPSQGQYGGPPPPQGGYGGPQYGQASRPGGYGGYYPPQGAQPQYAPQQQQAPPKKGMGAGGALLGAGAGLVGGALLMDAFEDHSEAEYDQGFQQGAAADDGGDFGGGDDGGDFGGDDGGGDF